MRKRPLNKKEVARKEDDIVTVCDNVCLAVHEPKLKVCFLLLLQTLMHDFRFFDVAVV